MKEYKIGIIEDTLEELNSIKRTIHSHLSKNYIINYKDYEISSNKVNLYCAVIPPLTKSSKNSPTSSGSEMNCKRNLNGSGGRREIGIPR